MPTRVYPFAADSPRSSPEATAEKRANKLVSFFSSPKARGESSALEVALVAQQRALLRSPSPPQVATPSLPTINLTTATGEKMPMEPTMLFQPPSPGEAQRLARAHAQFGPLGSQAHLYTSKFGGGEFAEPVEDEPPLYFLLTTYISYLILIVFGHVRDFFGKRFRRHHYRHLQERDGYAPLNSDFDNFYTRRLKMRINDCFSRPTSGVPGRYVTLLDRSSDDGNNTFRQTGTKTETLNMSSYNYLGFAQSEGPCADATEAAIHKLGLSLASPRADAGTSDLTVEVEELVAQFVGKPAAMVFSMGYATNTTTFSALVGKGSLIVSDMLNHSSIRNGARWSGSVISAYRHNDMRDLERLLRDAIANGQPRTHRPWRKIVVVAEGLYSMEGTMCNLPALVRLKKKYKFYLYVDEAHSIGALGPRGRGVCDYFGIDADEVDVLMGTLTKSFGANGGYIAASKAIIDHLRTQNSAMRMAESISPPVLVQIASSLRIITGELRPGQGEERLQRLAFNSRYLRLGLKRLGFIVWGQDDSPIVPLLLYHPAKMPAFSHEMLRRKISVVVVGYPATPLVSARARFCVSAAHTKDDLDRLLVACDEVGDVLQLKFSSGIAGGLPAEALAEAERKAAADPGDAKGGKPKKPEEPPRWRIDDVLRKGVDDAKLPLR